MRHGVKKRVFGRTSKKRDALMNSLARAFVLNSKVTTTQAKAKSLRTFVEKLITKGKTPTLAIIRQLIPVVGKDGADKITKEISPKFIDRAGGYTQIYSLPPRISDGAKMASIQLVVS